MGVLRQVLYAPTHHARFTRTLFYSTGESVKRSWAILGGAALAVAAFALWPRGFSYGSAELGSGGIDRDPHHLDPSFAKALEKLFRRLRAQGFDPVLFEGYRSPARAAQLHAANPANARENSVHSYGAAADVISASRQWDDPTFFKALGAQAEALGLTWGGRWSKNDFDHVQAIAVADEPAFFAMAPVQRATMIKSRLG